MSCKTEYWDLFDADGAPTGETMKRGDPVPKGRRHLVVEIWTVDGKGKILLTKRHPDKHFPDFWECTGGSVTVGEAPLEGAVRELYEETGISALPDELTELGRETGEHCIRCSFLLKKEVALGQLSLQAEEVTEARWVTAEEFRKMAQEGKIVPVLAELFEKYGLERKMTL